MLIKNIVNKHRFTAMMSDGKVIQLPPLHLEHLITFWGGGGTTKTPIILIFKLKQFVALGIGDKPSKCITLLGYRLNTGCVTDQDVQTWENKLLKAITTIHATTRPS